MTKFEGTFSGHTTGDGGKVLGGLATAAVIGALAFESLKGAASTIGSVFAIGATALAATALGVTGTVIVLRLRGRGRNTGPPQSGQQVSLLRTNPNAIPPREHPAIAAPAQYVTNNFFGVDAAAYLREQTPVYRATAETVEQQEIQR